MSKFGSDKKRQQSRETSLEVSLSKLGENGTNFLARLESAHPIPAILTTEEKYLLGQINDLAALVPSDPYSAVVLRDRKLYIAQNQATAGNETEEDLIARLQDSAEYKVLPVVGDLDIRVRRFDRSIGDHPDTVAIAFALESSPQPLASKASFLGLAASNSQRPASCSSCGAVIKALNDNGYKFKVASYTPTNFPSNSNYSIPQIILRDPKLFDSYLNNISLSIKSLEQKIASKNIEDLYVQYNTRDKKRFLMKNDSMNQESITSQFDKLDSDARDQFSINGSDTDKFHEQLNQFREQISSAKEKIAKSYSSKKFIAAAEEIQHLKQQKIEIQKTIKKNFKLLPQDAQSMMKDKISLEKVQNFNSSLTTEISTLKGQIIEATNRTIDNNRLLELANVQRRRKETADVKYKETQKDLNAMKIQKNDNKARLAKQNKLKELAVLKSTLDEATTALKEIEGQDTYKKAATALGEARDLADVQRETLKQLNDRLIKVNTISKQLSRLEKINSQIKERENLLSAKVVPADLEETEYDREKVVASVPQESHDKELAVKSQFVGNTEALSEPSTEHDKQNAFNQQNNPSYYYQDKDINVLAPRLINKEHVNYGIYSGSGFSDVKKIKENYTDLDKPIIGIYNVNGNHWSVFATVKDQDTAKLLYKDSQGATCPDNIKEAAKLYNDNQEVTLVENTKQEQGATKEVDVNCGIYALENARIIATNITLGEENKKRFIEHFKQQEFCNAEQASEYRKDLFATEYLQATIDNAVKENPPLKQNTENLKRYLADALDCPPELQSKLDTQLSATKDQQFPASHESLLSEKSLAQDIARGIRTRLEQQAAISSSHSAPAPSTRPLSPTQTQNNGRSL